MTKTYHIREEHENDFDAISEMVKTAFDGAPHSDGSEWEIILKLREEGDLERAFVAVQDEEIIGHIAFTKVTIDGKTGWYGLGPLATSPSSQGQGIGKALIEHGFQVLKSLGAKGCVVFGDFNYYSRSGFQNNGAIQYGDYPTEYLHWIAFDDETPQGKVVFANAFEGK